MKSITLRLTLSDVRYFLAYSTFDKRRAIENGMLVVGEWGRAVLAAIFSTRSLGKLHEHKFVGPLASGRRKSFLEKCLK